MTSKTRMKSLIVFIPNKNVDRDLSFDDNAFDKFKIFQWIDRDFLTKNGVLNFDGSKNTRLMF